MYPGKKRIGLHFLDTSQLPDKHYKKNTIVIKK